MRLERRRLRRRRGFRLGGGVGGGAFSLVERRSETRRLRDERVAVERRGFRRDVPPRFRVGEPRAKRRLRRVGGFRGARVCGYSRLRLGQPPARLLQLSAKRLRLLGECRDGSLGVHLGGVAFRARGGQRDFAIGERRLQLGDASFDAAKRRLAVRARGVQKRGRRRRLRARLGDLRLECRRLRVGGVGETRALGVERGFAFGEGAFDVGDARLRRRHRLLRRFELRRAPRFRVGELRAEGHLRLLER